jgi:hypothetical protein
LAERVGNHVAVVQEATSSYELRDDPDFDYLASGRLADLFRVDRHVKVADCELLVVCGPGAARVSHALLWYADLPKRYAEDAIPAGGLNLRQPGGAGGGTTKSLFFIEWPLLDRHRDEVATGLPDLRHHTLGGHWGQDGGIMNHNMTSRKIDNIYRAKR